MSHTALKVIHKAFEPQPINFFKLNLQPVRNLSFSVFKGINAKQKEKL